MNIPDGYTPDEWSNFNFFGNLTEIDYQLQEIKDFLKEFQKYIEVTNVHLKEGKFIGYDQETLESMKVNFEYSHGDILRKSTIISLYIMLELELGKFCQIFKKHSKSKLSLGDFKGDILEGFKKYAVKVMNLNFDFNSQVWQYIVGIHELRNCLVHNGGVIEDYNKKAVIEDFVRRNLKFDVRDERWLEITFAGCDEAIDKVDEFFNEITGLAFILYPGHYGERSE